jgi:hypothetical protein
VAFVKERGVEMPKHGRKQRRGAVWAECLLLLSCFTGCLAAQEMQPRAYIPAPVGLNFFAAGYSKSVGGLLFDPSLPVEDAHVNANIVTLAFGQSLGLLGRTSQILLVLPYLSANLNGLFAGAETHLYRSGLGDAAFRFSINIHGAPAMRPAEYAKYRQKTIVGASITMSAPMGQYDPARLINIGANRWAFKPELGVSRALGKWTLEGAAGVWLYTSNDQFAGSNVRTQAPLGSLQWHLVRAMPHRIWLALDGTFFTGGRSTVAGQEKNDYQGNTRWGATFGYAFNRRQAIKVSYFQGITTRIGADTRALGVSYNVIWKNGRKKEK